MAAQQQGLSLPSYAGVTDLAQLLSRLGNSEVAQLKNGEGRILRYSVPATGTAHRMPLPASSATQLRGHKSPPPAKRPALRGQPERGHEAGRKVPTCMGNGTMARAAAGWSRTHVPRSVRLLRAAAGW